jgi:hypothetical protein
MQVSLAYGDDFLNYMENRKEKIPLFYAKKLNPTPTPTKAIPTVASSTATTEAAKTVNDENASDSA